MSSYTASLQNLMQELSRLPGIGARSAERIAFHLLKLPKEDAVRIAEAIIDVKTRIKNCSRCYNLTESDPCRICSDARRDQGLVCVVEQPKDLLALESAGTYTGAYHVLLGRISPLDGQGPEDLTLPALFERIARGEVRELILGTNPTMDGDGTALYIANHLKTTHPDLSVTKLARGLPAGGSIEFANKSILADALAGRRKM